MKDLKSEAYNRVSEPQTAWGREVLARQVLAGDETVVDAGCGSGRLTADLAARLPRGRVIAVDISPAMLEEARRHLAGCATPIEFVQADLATLVLASPVDVVFSAATFHWVLDHDALFERMAAVLRPGGRLLAQFGGAGNLVHVLGQTRLALEDLELVHHLDKFQYPAYFAGLDQTRARLRAAGFSATANLEPRPTSFESEAAFREFVSHVVLRHVLEVLPGPTERDALLRRLAERLGPPFTLDYVRLNVDAVRS
jgi:ubiquinone/menaquinone biosynthesis C-methylase UbiE